MKYNYEELTYFVDVIDNRYVGKCKEFPRLNWTDFTQEDAYSGIMELVKAYIEEMFPEPKKFWNPKKRRR